MLSIIHLSDIHLKSKEDTIFQKRTGIVDAVKNRVSDSKQLVVLISGDIAFSGKEKEYLAAIDFFEGLRGMLNEYTQLEISFFLVPGNHDCNYLLSSQTIRDAIIEKVISTRGDIIDNSVIEQCCEPQREYFEFLELLDNDIDIFTKLFFHKEIKIDDFSVSFLGYNTAWLSQKDEERKSIFPINLFPKIYEPESSDFVISTFHHPYNWLDSNHYRDFRNHIESKSDIVLTGHEHVQEKRKNADFKSNITEYIESGALQESAQPHESKFNLIKIDFKNRKQKIINFIWTDEKFEVEDKTKWIEIDQVKNVGREKFTLEDRFKVKLNDVGASFDHPRKTPLVLSDVFVHPDFRLIRAQKKNDRYEEVLNSEEVIGNFIEKKESHIILLGEEKSGKTTLCKVYFKEIRKNDLIPIYIEGRKIKTFNPKNFKKLIYQLFQNQYSEEQLEKFKQEDKDKIVLIIDNIDRSKLNTEFRNKLLRQIYSDYSKTIITGDDFFKLEGLMGKEDLGNFLESVSRYEILEFGHLLRSKLIKKWNRLGRQEFIEEEQLVNANDRARNAINTVIGKNFVPSYPIFLLTILQTLEIGNSTNLQASSYGHYYEYLITQSLNRVIKQHEELEAIKSYLTELAFKLYTEGKREISETNFKKFHKWYCEEYAISPSFSVYKDKLISSSIIEVYTEQYFFKYKYIYYFFAARHFANNISEDAIKEEVKLMTEKVYKEEYANILMFLTHLSKDPFILKEILENSKKIFKEIEIIKFENDVESINNLLDEIPKVLLKDKNYQKSREEKYKIQDKIEYEKNNQEKEHSEEDEFDTLSDFNKAYKSLEILGQILKNYYGSLKGKQKYEIGEEAYKVGLRALNSFFHILEEGSESIVEMIKKELEREDDLAESDEREIESKSRELFFKIASLISYSFIKKISSSIGYDKLEETFASILKENNFNSIKLIDASIKLDYQKGFPEEEIKQLNDEFEGNLMSRTLLRRLVINYLYMFPTDFKRRQKICSTLGISMGAQRAIESKTSRKKG